MTAGEWETGAVEGGVRNEGQGKTRIIFPAPVYAKEQRKNASK